MKAKGARRKSSAKRSRREEALAAAVAPTAPAAPTGNRRRWLVVIAASVLVLPALAYSTTRFLAPAGTVEPKVVEGDGVRGPKGMVWIPGGEFRHLQGVSA
jgi:formylglycine-generating enzyme